MPMRCVAIDGPVAGGKSTAARAVAQRLGMLFVDTGAMYRAATLLALRAGVDLDDEDAVLRLLAERPVWVRADSTATLGYRVGYGDVETGAELFGDDVSRGVSRVAAHPGVRREMVAGQRALAESASVVMAGRDIGTVVLPDAACKVYLTAAVETRVARRFAELEADGRAPDLRALQAGIEQRDRLDSTRTVAPLEAAADATIIDSSELTPEEVVQRIVDLAMARLGPEAR